MIAGRTARLLGLLMLVVLCVVLLLTLAGCDCDGLFCDPIVGAV